MIALALTLALASADPPPAPKQWTITVDPLTELLGFVHVQVERAFSDKYSLYLAPSLKLFDSPLGIGTGPFRGYGLEAGVRGFITGTAPEGMWIMLRAVLAAVTSANGVEPGGYGSVLVGYTAILGPGLVLSGGLGISYFAYGPPFGIHGFLPAAHTNIGWAF
ncbi:MAG: hypothetical protein QM817_24705 [Archangium sp.]